MNDTNTRPDTIQLLVVADTWCDAEQACEEVWENLRERPGKVFVISPALTGRLHTLVRGPCRLLALSLKLLPKTAEHSPPNGRGVTPHLLGRP